MNERKFRCIENITDQMGNVYIEKGQILTIEEFKQFWKENNFVGNLYEKICINFQEITQAEEILKKAMTTFDHYISIDDNEVYFKSTAIYTDEQVKYLQQLLGEQE